LVAVAVAVAEYAEGPDHSTATFHARGTNDGSLAGMPATGQRMDVPFCEVLRFDTEGRCTEGEVYYDQMTILTQLGLVTPPGASQSGGS
jgi:hypothetical protein